jgi:hypothetical protein
MKGIAVANEPNVRSVDESRPVRLVHLVRNEWPGGPPGTVTLCGYDRATRTPPADRVVDCLVCVEIARKQGYRGSG